MSLCNRIGHLSSFQLASECVQERERRLQVQSRVEAVIAEISAARAEVAALKAVKRTLAEQALSHEAQVTASHC